MTKNETLDFTIEKIEMSVAKMDNNNVLSGCWGDSGSDWANSC